MKICYLGNIQSIHMQRWANFFADRGHDVTIITWHPKNASACVHPNIRIRRIWFPPHSFLRYGALLELFFIIHQVKPEIIHAHYVGHFGILASLYKKITGFTPIFMTAWGSDILIDAKDSKLRLIQKALVRADLITCDALHMKKTMEELGIEGKKIHIIYFGTDTKKFALSSKNNSVRTKYGILNEPVIISLRSLEPIYDIATLIRATSLIKKEFPNVKVIIGGKGSLESDLKQLSMDLGVSDNIIFAGFIQSDELPTYITSADVYVSTSLSDAGLAASTAEAMACGIPVVITDFGNNSEWVTDGKGGYLFPPHDHTALAKALITLIKDEEKCKSFGLINHQIIEERNNYYTEMKKVEDLYQLLKEEKNA